MSSSSSSARPPIMSYFDAPLEDDLPSPEWRKAAAEAVAAALGGSRIWQEQRRAEERAASERRAAEERRRRQQREDQQGEDAGTAGDQEEEDLVSKAAAEEAMRGLDARLLRRAAAHARRYRRQAAAAARGGGGRAVGGGGRDGDGAEAEGWEPGASFAAPERLEESEPSSDQGARQGSPTPRREPAAARSAAADEGGSSGAAPPPRPKRGSGLAARAPRPLDEHARALVGELDRGALRDALRYERQQQRGMKRRLAALEAARGPVLRPLPGEEEEAATEAGRRRKKKKQQQQPQPRKQAASSRPAPPPPPPPAPTTPAPPIPTDESVAAWASARRAVLLTYGRARLAELCAQRGVEVGGGGRGGGGGGRGGGGGAAAPPALPRLKGEIVDALLETEVPGVGRLLELRAEEAAARDAGDS